MRAACEIRIPGAASLHDVRSVVEFLKGLGYVRVMSLEHMNIWFEWEPRSPGAEPTGIAAVALAATAEEYPAIKNANFEHSLVRALDMVATWEEIAVELQSRGWAAPVAVRHVSVVEQRRFRPVAKGGCPECGTASGCKHHQECSAWPAEWTPEAT